MTPAEFRAARIKLGLTQARLGALLGFSKGFVSNMEKGRKDIQTVTALAINLLVDPKLNRSLFRNARSNKKPAASDGKRAQ